MEKDDQMLKDLLKEGFLSKAPDNFTDRVMMNVAETEIEESSSKYLPMVYASIILGSVFAFLGILFYTNSGIVERYQNYFLEFLSAMLSPFSGVLEKFTNLNFQLPFNGMLMGVAVIVIALLAFDRYVLGRKRYLNLFV